MSRNYVNSAIAVLATLTLFGCAQTPEPIQVNPDRMETDALSYSEDAVADDSARLESDGFQRIDTLDYQSYLQRNDSDPAKQFSTTDSHSLSANELPMRNFIETVFGNALNTNYVIAVTDDTQLRKDVTLNLSNQVSSRELFEVSRQLLVDNGLDVSFRDNTYYIYPRSQERTDIVIGFGRRYQDIPDTAQTILQVVPMKYGMRTSLERTLRDLSTARVSTEMAQNAFIVEGSRAEIVRFLDLVHLLDVPANRGKHIAMVELTYLSPDQYIRQLKELMDGEGISVGEQAT